MHSSPVILTLAPDPHWLPLLETALHRYGEATGISEPVRDMMAGALLESCEELLRICRVQGITEPYQVAFASQDEAAIVRISYSDRVPLNPHETGNYARPEHADAVADLNTDALWLHLIKTRMDRVSFKIDGQRRVLEMIKYRRAAGKTRQFWVMGLAPQLRPELHVEIRTDGEAGERAVIQDARTGRVLQLDAGSTFIVQRLDGKRTFQEIYLEYTEQVGLIAPRRLAMIFETLETNGLLVCAPDRTRNNRLATFLHRLLNPDFSIPHADRWVTAVYRCSRFLFNPFAVTVLILLGLSGLIPLLGNAGPLLAMLGELDRFYYAHPAALLAVYLLLLVFVAVHEFGHGTVCKHFGGRVERLGVMFYLAMFIFYCDVSSAWNFPQKRQRLLVSLGGPLISFAMLGVMLWIAGALAGSGTALAMIWITACLLAGYALIMCFNPFIRMDAYYLLMDWTGIPNLRERSFRYLRDALLGRTGQKPATGELTARTKRIFLWYGIFGVVVSVGFILLPFYYYGRMLLTRGFSGQLTLGIVIIALLLARFAQQAAMQLHAHRHRTYKIS